MSRVAALDLGTNSETVGDIVVVLPDGTLVNMYLWLQGTEEIATDARIEVVRSTDRGAVVILDHRILGRDYAALHRFVILSWRSGVAA